MIDGADVVQEGWGRGQVLQAGLQSGGGAFLFGEDIEDGLLNRINGRFELFIVLKRHLFVHRNGMCDQRTIDTLLKIHGFDAMQTFEDCHHCIFAHFRHRDDLDHMRHRAERVQIRFFGIGGFVVLLRQQDDGFIVFLNGFDQFETAFLGNSNRHHHSRKDHIVLNREYFVRFVFYLIFIFHNAYIV